MVEVGPINPSLVFAHALTPQSALLNLTDLVLQLSLQYFFYVTIVFAY
jgi:hypothetical protein